MCDRNERLHRRLQSIADMAVEHARNRADWSDWRDWSDSDAYRRFVALLRTTTAWVAKDGRRVVCRVDGPDVDVWGYLAAESLDCAGSDGMPRAEDWGEWRIDELRPGAFALAPIPAESRCVVCYRRDHRPGTWQGHHYVSV